MVANNILDKECFKTNDTLADQKVGNGTALFFAAQYSTGIRATKTTGLYTARPDLRYVPVGPLNDITGKPLVQIESQGRTGSPVIFFPSTCRNIEAAMRFIDYVNTIEGMTLTNYGIEGQTFVRNAQGQPRLIPRYLERMRAGDSTWEDEFREIGGANYIGGRLWYGSTRMKWFGETGAGQADAATQELEDYKLLRPATQFPGYALDAFSTQFPDYERLAVFAFQGDTERTYRERAYFANSEAEARQILLDYQNYLRTSENGLFMRYLDFMAEKARSRRDIAF